MVWNAFEIVKLDNQSFIKQFWQKYSLKACIRVI